MVLQRFQTLSVYLVPDRPSHTNILTELASKHRILAVHDANCETFCNTFINVSEKVRFC